MPPLHTQKRNLSAPAARLLDQDELNLGSIQVVPPAQSTGLIGNPVRLLNVECPSRNGTMVTVVMGVLAPILDPQDANRPSGPVVGIIEFGSGSARALVEFDVPIGGYPMNGTFIDAAPPGPDPNPVYTPQALYNVVGQGGVAVTVPGSSVRVYARNDAFFRPSSNEFSPPVTPPDAPPAFGPVIGQPNNPAPQVLAFIDYGVRPATSRLYRTIPFFLGATTQSTYVAIPPFAKSFFIKSYQGGAAATFTVQVRTRSLLASQTFGPFTQATGTNPTVFPLTGQDAELYIQASGDIANVVNESVVFEIGF